MTRNLVEEGKTLDEGLTISDNVVVEQFHNGNHGKTSVLEFLGLTLDKDFLGKVGFTDSKGPETLGLDESDDTEHLSGSDSGEDVKGVESVGDIRKGSSVEIDITRPAVEFRDYVSDNGKHGDTSVLELDRSPALEVFLSGSIAESKRVEESGGGQNADLLRGIKGGERSAGGLLRSRGESSSGGNEGGGEEGLHLDVV